MKKFKRLFISSSFICILTTTGLFFSCGDSGVTQLQNSGSISLSGLKPIDKNTTGTYELWGSIESGADHDENAFRSMGRFAVTQTGEITDTSGGSFSPNLGRISNINNVSDVIVTIQPPGYFDTIPSNIKIIGGPKQIQGGELVFTLSMSYSDILPPSSLFSSSTAAALLASPSTGMASLDYKKGLWFAADTNANTPGLTVPVLADTTEWTYQAWVVNDSNPVYIYNMGRFDRSNAQDNNQQCQQNPPQMTWLLPGHDWILANCPGGTLPDINDLATGYSVFITLEPRYEQGSELTVPFYIKLFTAPVSSGVFGTVFSLLNVSSSNLPSGELRLKAN
ncbi:MAG: hypothetical protein IAE90_05745 [Ignavibacteria bacterium]|nr:hypothetical protein [Ignavibacteria bacterium]